MRAVLCVALLLLTGLAHAEGAGEPRWLFVPVVTGELPSRTPPAALTAEWEAAMRAQGDSVVPNESGGALVEARHSSEPIRVDNTRLAELVRIVDEGQQHLSRTEREAAQQALRAVSEPEREFLLRDPEQAQKLFDTCMMSAALLLRERPKSEQDKRTAEQRTADAEAHVAACAEGFPAFFPPKRKGPPQFQAVIARVQKRREQEPSGTLTVTSEPPGCAVRLNGGAVGTTPATLASVGVGSAHVQIECDPQTPGRTHALTIRVGDNQLAVDAIFEAALHTRDGLWLSFATDDVRRRQGRSAGERLAHVLGDPRIVLLVLEGHGDDIVIQPVPLFASVTGLKPVRWRAAGADEAALRADVQALRQALPPTPKPTAAASARVTRELVAATPETVEPLQVDQRSTPIVRRSSWPGVVAGATATVVGVSAIAVAWVVYTQRETLRLELRAQVDQSIRSGFDARGPWVVGAGLLGSLSLSAAMPFLLPTTRGVPTWAWVVGGLGVAVLGTGLGYSAFERHCEPAAGATVSGCRRFTADATFGPLLAMHALPLLAVPGSFLVRDWQRPSTGIQLGLEGGVLSLRGSF